MTVYSFLVHGNHEDVTGNPVPFQRVIKQKMRASAARYLMWQQYVRACFYDYANKNGIRILGMKHPIELAKGQRCMMLILIGWANGHHGDTDNVWKGIADALFVNDKDIDVFAAGIASNMKRGYVHIRIVILEAGESYDPLALVRTETVPLSTYHE